MQPAGWDALVHPGQKLQPGSEMIFRGPRHVLHAEVVAVARLNHPCIIPVYDLIRDADNPALLVMAYRSGPSLGQLTVDDLCARGSPSIPAGGAVIGLALLASVLWILAS